MRVSVDPNASGALADASIIDIGVEVPVPDVEAPYDRLIGSEDVGRTQLRNLCRVEVERDLATGAPAGELGANGRRLRAIHAVPVWPLPTPKTLSPHWQ